MNGISIRPAISADVPAIATLLEQLARRYITVEFTSSAEEKFLKSNDRESISTFFAAGFQYWIAERSGALVGFIGIRDHSHLYHLFVAESERNQGVGRALWQTAEGACRAVGNPGRFTVNSSNNAIGVYEAFGFVRTGPCQNSEGVLFNPMVLEDAE